MVSLNGLSFTLIEATTTIVGSTKGGWMHSSQRPCHEVKLPQFYIMDFPLTEAQVARAMGAPVNTTEENAAMESLTSLDLLELSQHIMTGDEYQNAVKQHGGSWEVRPPTYAEWMTAMHQNILNLAPGYTERLADAPAANFHGAMMDGRPRPQELLGPASLQHAAIAVHPKNMDVTALTSVPTNRALPQVVGRLVFTPIRQGPAKRVPLSTDRWAIIRSELLWTSVLGILPSFFIPIMRGMSAYAVNGWANLLFGGLCAGFVTGAIWRPKRPILRYDDVIERR